MSGNTRLMELATAAGLSDEEKANLVIVLVRAHTKALQDKDILNDRVFKVAKEYLTEKFLEKCVTGE